MIRIGIPRQSRPGELRVALTPKQTQVLTEKSLGVWIEEEAGVPAGYPDQQYREAGADLVSPEQVWSADLIALVSLPSPAPDAQPGQVWLGLLEPWESPEPIRQLAQTGATVFAFEAMPRTTRAQPMDALSSQATAAGYQAVLVGASASGRFLPMLTTAAGTIPPAQVVVLGAGVAGLQAIATAHRLGAVVSGFDVRSAAAEQVMSLGAKFIDLEIEQQDASQSGGYAQQVAEDTGQRIIQGLAPHLEKADLVITTAAIPGRTAPLLIPDTTVQGMKHGAVIVDLAASTGGNCQLTLPDETRVENGVTIIGDTNIVSGAAYDASQMYAKNVTALIELITSEGELALDFSDEIIDQSCLAHGGEIRHPRLQELIAKDALPSG